MDVRKNMCVEEFKAFKDCVQVGWMSILHSDAHPYADRWMVRLLSLIMLVFYRKL